ncbi:uncharacterized protein mettl21ca [Tautogolabrus adspersus]
MGVSNRMLCLYNLALRSPDACAIFYYRSKQQQKTGIHMATLSSYYVEETSSISSREECDEVEECEEVEDIEDRDEENKEEEKDESAIQKHQKPAWAPCFYNRMGREVFSYVGQEIVIEEGLDSYAGMIWPAALTLCHFLDTNRKQISLMDKGVLEIGAGTGLVSIVATLLGAWVTATDLPEVLNKLSVNLNRNTRGYCRHTPQVAALSWGYELMHTYPSSMYHYDYVLAADVVYHHDFLDELLVTMKHFCRPGTTLIWANKVRFETDLTFTENFKKAFHTTLLAEDGEMKIFMATCRGEEEEGDVGIETQDLLRETEEEKRVEAEGDAEPHNGNTEKCIGQKLKSLRPEGGDNNEKNKHESDEEVDEEYVEEEEENKEREQDVDKDEEDEDEGIEEITVLKDNSFIEHDKDQPEINCTSSYSARDEDVPGQGNIKPTSVQHATTLAWVRSINSRLNRDIYHYVGQDIFIQESIDSFGAVMWPAALALCSFLDNHRELVNLQGKEVLELGAGTGLVTIVASLLGALVTATDLPDVLGNLQANVMRNTRGRCRHMPQVAALSWGYDLDRTHPTSVYRYDYVLSADVVYHHDFLDELLVTMKHFCRPGTTLIWANKVRFETDLTFTENFKKAFHTTLLAEDGEMKIFMATCRA